MAKKIERIRFYKSDDNRRNCPTNITMNRLISGSAFNNKYPISFYNFSLFIINWY